MYIHICTCTHTQTHTHTHIVSENGIQQSVKPNRNVDSTATHGATLQHTATHCNTLQHAATNCNTRTLDSEIQQNSKANPILTAEWRTAAHCSTLQHTAVHCRTLQHAATRCNTLQHTAAYAHQILEYNRVQSRHVMLTAAASFQCACCQTR